MSVHPVTPNALQGSRILAAEDHPVNRRLMEFLFSDMGCEIEVVSDGMQVLEAMREESFDVVLLDLQMPELDGFQTAHAIQHEFGDTAPPVFAVSADISQEARKRCSDSHIEGLLPKPLTREDVAKVLGYERRNKYMARPTSPSNDSWSLPADFAMLAPLGQSERIHNILRIFVQDGALRMEALMGALQGRNVHTITQLTHSLCGSAGQVGATQLAKSCRNLEDYTRETGSISIKRMFAVIMDFDKAEHLIDEFLAKSN